ncbi:protein FAM200A-like [Tachypleus tridentatus]|uniref:protein FAM200A-like n=1 Tax=Tachypleus tridentatus TaxID=6853 RepID=UPI003FD5987A
MPLSNDTISHRIQHMAEDLNDHLIEKMKGKEFGLHLDEAMDSNKDAHLICCTWFVDGDKIVEDLLVCKNIRASTKAQDLFENLDTFICENSLDWTKCIGVCTDGGRSMSGCYEGFIQSKALDALWTHCIIYRSALPTFAEDMEKFARIQDSFNVKALSEFNSAEEENLIQLYCDKLFLF